MEPRGRSRVGPASRARSSSVWRRSFPSRTLRLCSSSRSRSPSIDSLWNLLAASPLSTDTGLRRLQRHGPCPDSSEVAARAGLTDAGRAGGMQVHEHAAGRALGGSVADPVQRLAEGDVVDRSAVGDHEVVRSRTTAPSLGSGPRLSLNTPRQSTSRGSAPRTTGLASTSVTGASVSCVAVRATSVISASVSVSVTEAR